jgi:hypothetical protein
MRIALLLVLALSLAACGKKKAPASPATSDSKLEQDADEKDQARPDDADEAPTTRSSDPMEGGE